MEHPHSLRAANMQNAFGATALHLAVAQQAAGSFVDTGLFRCRTCTTESFSSNLNSPFSYAISPTNSTCGWYV